MVTIFPIILQFAESFELGAAGACVTMVVVEKTVGVVNDNERVGKVG